MQDLVVGRAELENGPVQRPGVVGGEDADVAAASRVFLARVPNHLGEFLRQRGAGGGQPDGSKPTRLHRHGSLGQAGPGGLVLLGHADHFLVELGSSQHGVCRWQTDLEQGRKVLAPDILRTIRF